MSSSFGRRTDIFVVPLYSIPESKLLLPILDQLASLYPSTKFVKIVSDHCIENYPDKNVPTMLIYRKGQMMGQVVGLGSVGGMKATLRGKSNLVTSRPVSSPGLY